MKKILIPIVLLCMCSCSSKSTLYSSEYNFQQSDVGIYIKASVSETVNTKNLPISAVVGDSTGSFLIQPRSQSSFDIVFSKAKYVDKILFQTDASNSDTLTVDAEVSYSYNDLPSHQELSVCPTNGIYTFNINKSPLKIRKIYFSLESLKLLNIKKIRFVFADKSNYVPKLSFSSILSNFVKNDSLVFADRQNQDLNESDVLNDLIYYALDGNKNAENVFLKYSPAQADSGEATSSLKEGYAETKKTK